MCEASDTDVQGEPRGAPTSLCMRPPGADAFVVGGNSFAPFLSSVQDLPLLERLECLSRRFLGIRYEPDPLGEGNGAGIDDDPTYRFDAIDCMTFVEEVVALSFSGDAGEFTDTLGCIRYRDCVHTYAMRNHHVEDWVRENSARNYIRDITGEVGGSLVKRAVVEIDFMRWIEAKPDMLPHHKDEIRTERMARDLKDPTPVEISFVPLRDILVVRDGTVSMDGGVSSRIPAFSIMLLIGKAEDEFKFGTRVRHMGIVLAGGLAGFEEPTLRHCTPKEGCADRPLIPYLFSQMENREGVAFLEVLDKHGKARVGSPGDGAGR
ncbi:MAG TPA: DUF1460 domain-containing protein [bacterium]|nr:DUF1460 domain-containing protein [bacterium]